MIFGFVFIIVLVTLSTLYVYVENAKLSVENARLSDQVAELEAYKERYQNLMYEL